MNYRIIPQKMACNICNNIQEMNSDHCSACGVSFKFGKQDAWNTRPYAQNNQPCLFDDIPLGTITGMVCTCPKCSPR